MEKKKNRMYKIKKVKIISLFLLPKKKKKSTKKIQNKISHHNFSIVYREESIHISSNFLYKDKYFIHLIKLLVYKGRLIPICTISAASLF